VSLQIDIHGPKWLPENLWWLWPEFEALESETLEVIPSHCITLPEGTRAYTGALGFRIPLIFRGQARMTLWHDFIVEADQWGPSAFSDALAMKILEQEGAWLATRMAIWFVIFPFGVWRAGGRSARRTVHAIRSKQTNRSDR